MNGSDFRFRLGAAVNYAFFLCVLTAYANLRRIGGQ